jgi:translation initiation factor 2 alpha subunit (eIF-2alpha)
MNITDEVASKIYETIAQHIKSIHVKITGYL